LQPGAPADVAVFDVKTPWTVDPARFYSKSRNSPFAGRSLSGRAVLTLVYGKVVYDAEAARTR
jgi:dihydroorotase